MDINSFVIGLAKGKKSGYFSTKENDAGGLTYAFRAKEAADGELNIAYGDVPPEDTTKLWVKTTEPSGVVVSLDKVFEGDAREASFEPITTKLTKFNVYGGAAAVGEKIYLFGGGSSTSGGYYSSIECFDTTIGVSTTLTQTLQSARRYVSCATVGTKIYLFGGSTNPDGCYDKVSVFDTETEELYTLDATLTKWNSYNKMGYDAIGTVVIGGIVYLFGGGYYSSSYSRGKTNIIAAFDTETETFLQDISSTLPIESFHCACEAVGTKVYVFDGVNSSIYRYDTETDELTKVGTIPTNGNYVRTIKVDNSIFVLDAITMGVYRFDVDTNKLFVLDVEITQYSAVPASANIGTSMYLLGGTINSTVTKDIYTFLTPLGFMTLQSGTMQIVPYIGDNMFDIINTDSLKVKVGVKEVYKGNENNHAKPVESALYKDGEWVTI